MSTATLYRPSNNGTRATPLVPEEIRRLVELGKQRGLIKDSVAAAAPDKAARIDRNGLNLAQLANVWMQKVDITPEMAAYWLKNNFRNRTISQDVVKAYARDMKAGKWSFTHQGIAFNDQDHLIDGQHRLHAIVMANVTVTMMVTFGLPSKVEGTEMTTMDCVDRGRTRSVSDQLTIQHGFKNGTITAAICTAIASICFLDRTRRLSVGQTLDVFREFEHAINWVIAHRSKQAGLRAGGVMAGFAFVLATEEARTGHRFWEGKEEIVKMFKSVMTGENLKDGSPMALLRAFLTGDEAKLFTPSLNRGLAELVMYAIHLQLSGKKVAKLELSLDGADYFRSLQKERVAKIAALFALPEQKDSGQAYEEAKQKDAPRPTLKQIFVCVCEHFKKTKAVMESRENDAETAFARTAFINLSLHYGYSFDQAAPSLNRGGVSARHLHISRQYLGKEQINAIEAIKAKLGAKS